MLIYVGLIKIFKYIYRWVQSIIYRLQVGALLGSIILLFSNIYVVF